MILDKLKCFLFGHPNNQYIGDMRVHVKISSALNPFHIVYCMRCKQIYGRESK